MVSIDSPLKRGVVIAYSCRQFRLSLSLTMASIPVPRMVLARLIV